MTLGRGQLDSQLHQVPEHTLRMRSNKLKNFYVRLAVQRPQQEIDNRNDAILFVFWCPKYNISAIRSKVTELGLNCWLLTVN